MKTLACNVQAMFQSALALSGEGNAAVTGLIGTSAGFNPPSPFRARGTGVALRSQHFLDCFNPPSPFRARGTPTGPDRCRATPRFNPPSPFRARGTHRRHASRASTWFQSALALSGEGNGSVVTIDRRKTSFNPPSPFRARGTRCGLPVTRALTSFNPPSPFRARGTVRRSRREATPDEFQSALALSGEGNCA